jgi:diguanylate cyclase (GGDEF)-like protein/PAS domain S-box-containing protein
MIKKHVNEYQEIEKKLHREREEQSALNSILRLSLEAIPLQEQLERVMDILLSLSWLQIETKGGIFQVDEKSDTLVLKVQRGLHPVLLTSCARVPFGFCLCGRAAQNKEIQHAECIDERHDVTFDGITPHGHYNVPILSGDDEVLGVIVLYLKHGHKKNYQEIAFLSSVASTLAGLIEHRMTQEELRLSAAVFENTTDGVSITDKNARIISVNRAFTEITGYSEKELIGKTPSILQSGHHDKEFYTSMWSRIHKHGSWRGEIWNKRKNGEIYPQWLSISVVKNEYGKRTNYIGVFSDISKLKEVEQKLEYLAHHDSLTGLPNRLLLDSRIKQSLSRATRNNATLAILFLDLDHFKNVNDTLGHPIGDLLLQEVSDRLLECTREEDLIARLGGDEFAIILEGIHDSRDAGKVASKIIETLSEKYTLCEHEVFISCSIGISMFPDDGNNPTELFRNADSALYRAKNEGRNNYRYYTEELTLQAIQRMRMEGNLRYALERNELSVYYQPQIDLSNGQIVGMEALLRWKHPELGFIPPSTFIPIAEDTGLIIPIGAWVLHTACAFLKECIDQGLPKIRVAVNISSYQFHHENLSETVSKILHETGLEAKCLELELTEGIVMKDAESSILILNDLKEIGVEFSIDDFGTGYSSLSYLKRFPIDRIKIDRSFVRNIITDSKDASIAQAIISMSHGMDIKVLAEGVETLEQQEFLRSKNCDEMQGYYFSHPLPEDDMKRLLYDTSETDN